MIQLFRKVPQLPSSFANHAGQSTAVHSMAGLSLARDRRRTLYVTACAGMMMLVVLSHAVIFSLAEATAPAVFSVATALVYAVPLALVLRERVAPAVVVLYVVGTVSIAAATILFGTRGAPHYYFLPTATAAWVLCPHDRPTRVVVVSGLVLAAFVAAETQLPANGLVAVPAAAYELSRPLVLVNTAAALFIVQFLSRREARRAEQLVYEIAATDALTGVANRRQFRHQGTLELERTLRYERALSVIVLDIDHFKQVNDVYGHAAGDVVLAAVAKRISEVIRATDVFGRIGGEEFALLLPETGLPGAVTLAQRIRRVVAAEPVSTGQTVISVTASLGVACARRADASIDGPLDRADGALYDAKRAGRNCVRCAAAIAQAAPVVHQAA